MRTCPIPSLPPALTTFVALLIGATASPGANPASLVLRNPEMRLELDAGPGGVPRIASAKWCADETTIFEADGRGTLEDWFPKALVAEAPAQRPAWREVPAEHLIRAEATRPLAHGLEAAWVVELQKSNALVRLHCRLANRSPEPVAVEHFPVFAGNWRIPASSGRVRWWEALSFRRLEQTLADRPLRLQSRYHSSDREPIPGVNPYWMLLGDHGRLMFCLSWCGGWQADLKLTSGLHHLSVALPPEETQLLLKPGETITGPVLSIVPTRGSDDRTSRASWLRERAQVGSALFGGPTPSFPFVWNHWYTVRFDIDENYLERQVAAMEPYAFDYFVVDAGWYESCGRWVPDPRKFPAGSFESLLAKIQQKGARPGIWTCPQFVKADATNLPAEVDRPGHYERFIDGHLLDLAGCDFRTRLLEHVAMLRQRYHAGWWKYDQLLFTPQTRHGTMRNVIAFQDALKAVRQSQPDLVIESCQSGGRMINEFTVEATQSQWLRDGSGTGLKHAKANFAEALGAMEFLPPWTAVRWMNRPYDNDPEDDELTRMYCRSCMAGVWGLVADLPRIPERQRKVILQEVEHYRRLSRYKTSCLYDLQGVEPTKPYRAVVFYSPDGRAAAVLVLRFQDGPFEAVLPLAGLADGALYGVEDVDRPEPAAPPATSRQTGLRLAFPAERLSALLLVNPSKAGR